MTQTIPNIGTAGALLNVTNGSSTAVDTNDAQFLDWDGINYVYAPGANNNAMSVPDANNLDITGDIDLRAYIALDDWTPSGNGAIIDKRQTGSAGISYTFNIQTNGTLRLNWTTDGTTQINQSSTVATGVTDGTAKWVRATLDVDNDAGGYDVRFFLSDDGITWTQLGTTRTGASTTSIFSGTGLVRIGGSPLGNFFITGKVYRAQILDGIGGTTVLDVDTSVITSGNATSFTALTGQTVTINRSTSGRKSVAVVHPVWLFGTDDQLIVDNRYLAHTGTNYLYLPGVASNFASTPDAAPLDITGDIDLRCKVALDDWTPGAAMALIAKATAGNTQRAYYLQVETDGKLSLSVSPDGTTASVVVMTSSIETGITDGAVKWVRATLDVDDGSGNRVAEFFLSDDGINWNQLGTTVTTAGTTSIFNSNNPLHIGARGATAASRGKFFQAQVLDGIGGTVVFDAEFETSITSFDQATFTESSTNAATVTINRSGTTYQSAGVIQAGYIYPGATNNFNASDTDFFSFPDGSDFSFLAIVRQWGNAVAGAPYINNITQTNATGKGWTLSNADTRIGGLNTTRQVLAYTPASVGSLSSIVVTKNNTPTLNVYINNTKTSAAYTQTGDVTTVDGTFITRIGRSSFAAGFQDFELIAAAVFRKALTDAEVKTITDYYQKRVGA